MEKSFESFLSEAAHVKPSKRQLRVWSEVGFYAFIHFSPNTYTGREWGLGNEDPAIFNPTELDCDEWVSAIKSAGMKGAVITAKHHDGFCLWQTAYTEHSIKNSPYKNGKGDIVRELSDACRRGGIEFGFYLSPWDRNSALYGTPEYNDYYKNQLRELLTNYGDVFYVWFDGACGEGPNGKKQEYDFPGYIKLIRELQPNAAIFNDAGPDIRWCGNESGSARAAEWAVVPHELAFRAEKQTDGALLDGELKHMYNTDADIGGLSNIMYSSGLSFCPSEIDMSIRPGWFYHASEEAHPLDRLFDTYINSVGGNTSFNLNIPPMPSGRFDPDDIERLHELGEMIKASFSDNLAEKEGVTLTEEKVSRTQKKIKLRFPECVDIHYVVLREKIAEGQRVESFRLTVPTQSERDETRFEGRTVGNRKICRVNIRTEELTVFITSARDTAELMNVEVY